MNTIGRLTHESPGSSHWDQILDFDLRYFPRPWNRAAWEDLDWEFHQLYGWIQGEKVIGFALFGLVPADKVGHLLKIFMEPSHRGRGETVLFWRELSFSLKSLGAESSYLEVEASNLRAISFYRKIGFQELRKIKSYYSDGTDALTMQLTL